jgi:GntR family transcriptional regulator
MTVGNPKLAARPLYLQVHDLLLQRITSGIWKPGTHLPAETDLAKELGVSSGTVRKALDTLESQRVITRQQGRGTFVNNGSERQLALRYDRLRGKDGQPIAERLGASELSSGPANEMERRGLNLDTAELIVRVRRVRLNRDRPFMDEEIALPARHFPGLQDRKEIPRRIAELAQEYGIVLGHAVEKITLAAASEPSASCLAVTSGTPLLELNRVVFAIDGRAVQWRRARCHLQDETYLAELS